MSTGAFESWRYNVERMIQTHPLRQISWEATRRCNLHCKHCGSPSEEEDIGPELDTSEVIEAFEQIATDFDMRNFQHINITGGEPLVRVDLPEILQAIHRYSFYRNIDLQTNGIALAQRPGLFDQMHDWGITGLGISLDGMSCYHDEFRQMNGAFELSYKAAQLGVEHGYLVTVSMVANAGNIDQIDQLYQMVKDGIRPRVFRLMTIDPLGRAANDKDLLLSPRQVRYVIDWLAEKYQAQCHTYEDPLVTMVELGCGGWLGCEMEGLFRPFVFHCIAGLNNLGILCDGKLASCSNIPRCFIEGDLRTDQIRDVWENRYQRFRDLEWKRVGQCAECEEWPYCHGGPMHKRLPDGTMANCLMLDYQKSGKADETGSPSSYWV